MKRHIWATQGSNSKRWIFQLLVVPGFLRFDLRADYASPTTFRRGAIVESVMSLVKGRP